MPRKRIHFWIFFRNRVSSKIGGVTTGSRTYGRHPDTSGQLQELRQRVRITTLSKSLEDLRVLLDGSLHIAHAGNLLDGVTIKIGDDGAEASGLGGYAAAMDGGTVATVIGTGVAVTTAMSAIISRVIRSEILASELRTRDHVDARFDKLDANATQHLREDHGIRKV